MKAQPTLICIPDISGFSEYMSEADFELSSKVIPSLLNKIVYANEIGLNVSEIEGDAVLFFKQGELPSFEALLSQCKKFYTEFYKLLSAFKNATVDSNEMLHTPDVLGLKIILHYGQEVAPVKVGSRIKLLGEDLITAHRLLKNGVPLPEYLLLSEELTSQYPEKKIAEQVALGALIYREEDYAHIGKVKYSYIPFDKLV